MDLTELLRTESERIEWKQNAHSNELLNAVCAFANDLSGTKETGYVVLGVDKRGHPLGIDVAGSSIDEIQQRVAGRIGSTKIFPTPSYSLRVADIGAATILIVAIQPYPVPPVVTVDGVAWIRRGTTTLRATDADLARLRERRPERNQPFDLRIVAGTTIDDLNVEKLTRVHEAERLGTEVAEEFPALESWMTQRQLGRMADGVWTPNAAALLLFGTSPQDQLPGAKVEFVRYAGIEVDSAVVERMTATGSLPDQIESLWARLNLHLASVPGADQGAVTGYHPIYPLTGLRELVRNLVQHRQYEGTNAPGRIEWYADRVEFSNPGGPYGRASEGEFGLHSDYRNPVITRWLVELGYVEQLGRGIRLVRLSLERNGNPALEVEVDGFTRVIVRRKS